MDKSKVKEYKEALKKELEEECCVKMQSVQKDCLHCGRCPVCGRGGYEPYYPYSPYGPLNPYPYPLQRKERQWKKGMEADEEGFDKLERLQK